MNKWFFCKKNPKIIKVNKTGVTLRFSDIQVVLIMTLMQKEVAWAPNHTTFFDFKLRVIYELYDFQ